MKIEPKAIGVGQYQHDVDQTALARTLDAVVEDCVNAVGVDVNTASAPLLARISGLNGRLAAEIVALPQRARRRSASGSSCSTCRGSARRRSSRPPASCGSAAATIRSTPRPSIPSPTPSSSASSAKTGVPVAGLIGRGDVLRTLDARRIRRRRFGVADPAGHPRGAREARTRSAAGVQDGGLQGRRPRARGPAAGHGARGRGHQRRELRRLRGRRRPPGRPRARVAARRPAS